jgi:hypothetical protein
LLRGSVFSGRGPEGYGDKEDLHRDTEPAICGRPDAKSYASARRVNIGGQTVKKKAIKA